SFFGYDASRLNLLTLCTWAFLAGLVGDTWLEVAVRSFYANQDTRTPLIAAFLQAMTFVILSLILSPVIALAGIPLSPPLTFTTSARVLSGIFDPPLSGPITSWNYFATITGLCIGGRDCGIRSDAFSASTYVDSRTCCPCSWRSHCCFYHLA